LLGEMYYHDVKRNFGTCKLTTKGAAMMRRERTDSGGGRGHSEGGITVLHWEKRGGIGEVLNEGVIGGKVPSLANMRTGLKKKKKNSTLVGRWQQPYPGHARTAGWNKVY